MSLVNSFDHFTDLGDTLCAIGVKESAAANEAFTKFGDYHRQMEKVGIHMLKKTKRVCKNKFILHFLSFRACGVSGKVQFGTNSHFEFSDFLSVFC